MHDGEASQKKLRELSSQVFACAADAKKAASRLLQKSKYHEIVDLKIIQVNNLRTANSFSYKVDAKVGICEEKVSIEKRSVGRFVLATNILNTEELTVE